MIPHHENWYDRNARSDSAISPPPNIIFADFLYLSSAPTAAYLPHLLDAGITHILNLSSCSNYWASQSDINQGWAHIHKTDRRFYASLVKRYGHDLANAPIPFGYIAPTYLHIDIEDAEDVSLADHFLECIAFIHQTRLENPTARILVHCYQGRSRSASMVIAYAMWAFDMSYQDAFRYVSEHRRCIAPNCGFVKQLLQFENELWSVRSLKSNSNTSSNENSDDDDYNNDDDDNDDDDVVDDDVDDKVNRNRNHNLGFCSSPDGFPSLLGPGRSNMNELLFPVVIAS